MEMKLDDGTASRISIPRGKRDVWVWDTETAGLFLRKFKTGRAMYGVKYCVATKPRTVHLRDAGERGSLAAARKEAGDVRAMARLNRDLLAERQAAKAAAAAEAKRKINTLGTIAKQYLAVRKGELRPRSYVEAERHILKGWKPLHGTPIEDITRACLVGVIDEIERKSGKVAADKSKASLATMFAWAIDRGFVSGTPIVHIRSRAGNIARDRVLTPAELRHVWRAATERGDDYGAVIRLLILTGQRRDEIGKLPWVEVVEADGGLRIDMPASRTKNGRAHSVWLSKPAIALLPPQPDPDDADPRSTVFGRRRHTGFSGWSKGKVELDAAIAALRPKDGIKREMLAWRIHDLRRTMATMLGDLGLAEPHVIEAILNHQSGSKGGIVGVYQRAEYWAERVKALDAWGAWIEANVAS